MHPQISWFISKGFYQSKLLDYEQISKLIGEPEYYKCKGLKPITFFHVEVKKLMILDKSNNNRVKKHL